MFSWFPFTSLFFILYLHLVINDITEFSWPTGHLWPKTGQNWPVSSQMLQCLMYGYIDKRTVSNINYLFSSAWTYIQQSKPDNTLFNRIMKAFYDLLTLYNDRKRFLCFHRQLPERKQMKLTTHHISWNSYLFFACSFFHCLIWLFLSRKRASRPCLVGL